MGCQLSNGISFGRHANNTLLDRLRDNEEAYNRYKLRPRVLRDVDGVDMSATIFGTKCAAPLGFAPSAAHKMAHKDGEIATSRAAAANNIPMCLSSYGSVSLEEVIAAGGSNPYAMQITFVRDLRATQEQIRRAERKCVYPSVVLKGGSLIKKKLTQK